MRRFFSYGPVNCEKHFCVQRGALLQQCVEQLIGDEEGGHYFTVWAPRQTGKTWLMMEVKKEIERRYGDKFICGFMSMEGISEGKEVFLKGIPSLFRTYLGIELKKAPENFLEFTELFEKGKGVFNKPLILFIDEFDSLLPEIIDALVRCFRKIYLKRDSYLLHGLALIGVSAVLGIDSDRGSPFNIQRSLHVDNFTYEEVLDLYHQYIEESSQKIDEEVIDKVYEVTRGQPGLVCWFGELLTEKYNPGKDKIIDIGVWRRVYSAAMRIEWNNTLLNLIKKAKGKYFNKVLDVFSRPDLEFNLRSDWCSYLYLNGIIGYDETEDEKGEIIYICRFSSPFVQDTLYHAFSLEFCGEETPIYALKLGDDLSDVFEEGLDLRALIGRYRDYLNRLKQKNISPFKHIPKRQDLNIYESGGHFHLYHWLMNAIGKICYITPEFPTGNGRVDIHIRCKDIEGVIEVKSFRDMRTLEQSKYQASKYAKKLGLKEILLVVFVYGVEEEEALVLRDDIEIEGVKVMVEPVVFDG